MQKSVSAAAGAFAARLRELMQTAGKVSESSRSGVDVVALAKAAGTSYEMARRYAEGQAIPRPDKLARIAAWLGIQPSALAWGLDEGATSTLNPEVLQQCIEAVITAQERSGISISTERAAALVTALYQEAMDGRLPKPQTVARMLRAMS